MALTPEQEALNFNPELQDVSRQRKLADLLMAQGAQQPQGQMISGHYVAPSWAQQLNPMANILASQAIGSRADTQEQQLAQALRGKQAQVMQAWQEAKTPQEKFAIGTSQYAPKELQAATYEMLKPQKLGEGETINQMNFGSGAFEPMAQGGQKIAPEVRQAMQLLGISKPLDQLSPQELQAINTKTTQIKQAGASNVTVHTGNALGSEFGKTIGAEDAALRQAAKNAEMTVQNADNALKNLDKAITGPNADIRLQAAKYLNVAGADNESTIKASEQAFAQRSQALLGRVKSSGLAGSQGLTEGERKFLTNAYGGNLNLDKETLKGMLTLEKKLAHRDATMWNQRIKEMPQEVVRGTGVGPVSIPNIGEVDTNNPLLR
jgi:hypothetical protein